MAGAVEARTGVARAADGAELSYTLRGREDAGGRRFVLVHSLALDRDVWTPVAERLASQGPVLTYDCRGHGASTKAPGPYTIELFAADLATVLDACGWRSAIVAGASMGGSVAQAFATANPDRVEALGLVDTTAWYGAEAPQQWANRARQAQENGFKSLIDFQLTRWFGDEFRAQNPELLRRLSEVFVGNDVGCYASTCGMMGAFDLREAIAGLRVPTAVIVGEEDYATPPAMARQIQAAIPGATLDVLPATRHLSPLERPEVIAGLFEQLAQRAAAAPAPNRPATR
jgi:3-oxoadipate enol-lactonase